MEANTRILAKTLKPSIGILLWDSFLAQLIEEYLHLSTTYSIERFEKRASPLSAEFVYRLKKVDLFITQAFNPGKIRDAEGFRLSLKIIDLGFKAKPIVIFRHIDGKYLAYPYFLDFESIHHLPKKIEALLIDTTIDKKPFDYLVQQYPILTKVPEHKRMV